jgi:hypothetical protein
MVSPSLLYAKYAPKYEHSKGQLRAIQETGLNRRIGLEAEEQGGARDDGRGGTYCYCTANSVGVSVP